MKVVECIDDKNLFVGGDIVEGNSYEVEREYMNHWGDYVYILKGIKNEGITPKGLRWKGYKRERFVIIINDNVSIKEVNYALN